jgi:hypothetical protein
VCSLLVTLSNLHRFALSRAFCVYAKHLKIPLKIKMMMPYKRWLSTWKHKKFQFYFLLLSLASLIIFSLLSLLAFPSEWLQFFFLLLAGTQARINKVRVESARESTFIDLIHWRSLAEYKINDVFSHDDDDTHTEQASSFKILHQQQRQQQQEERVFGIVVSARGMK